MRIEVRLIEDHWARLCEHVLCDDREHAAVLIAGTASDDGSALMLVREVFLLGEEDLLSGSSRLHLEVAPVTLARMLKRARRMDASLVICHSHPFPGKVAPSPLDLATERELCARVAAQRLGDRPVGSLILGPDGVSTRVYLGRRAVPARVRVVGSAVRILQDDQPATGPTGAYARQVLLWGAFGQAKLAQASAAVVGMGGTGSQVALQLAHLGIGRLVLIDPDVLETSNLSRVMGAGTGDVGDLKVDVIERAVRRIRPNLPVTRIAASVCAIDPGPLTGVDVVVCCTDGHGSRALLNELAYQYLVPLVDLGIEVQPAGAGSRAGGGVRIVRPGRPCLQCMGVLDPRLVREEFLSTTERKRERELGYLRGEAVGEPSVVALNGVVASMAVIEVCNLLVEMFAATPDRVVYRAEARATAAVGVQAESGCYVCGRDGLLGLGDARPLPRRREPRAG